MNIGVVLFAVVALIFALVIVALLFREWQINKELDKFWEEDD